MPAQSTRRVTGLATFEIECDPSVLPRDLVFIDSDGLAKKAKADNPATMPAIGYVVKKKPGNKAVVTKVIVDELTDLAESSAKNFFVSATEAGKLQDTAPAEPNTVRQIVGSRLAAGKVLISVNSVAVVRS